MPEQPPSGGEPSGGGESRFGFLGRKLGPFPVIVWGAIGFGAWWWWSHRSSSAQQQQDAGAGQQVTVVTKQGPVEVIKRTISGRRPVTPPKKTVKRTPRRRPRGPRPPVSQPGRSKPRRKPARKPAAMPQTVTRYGPTSTTATYTMPATTETGPSGQPVTAGGTTSQGGTGLIYEGPVYGDWVAEPDGQVPEPMQAYAPMTAGDIYGSDQE